MGFEDGFNLNPNCSLELELNEEREPELWVKVGVEPEVFFLN